METGPRGVDRDGHHSLSDRYSCMTKHSSGRALKSLKNDSSPATAELRCMTDSGKASVDQEAYTQGRRRPSQSS